MKRVYVDHVTAAGMHYGTLEARRSRRNRKKITAEMMIDRLVTVILTGWIFLFLWHGASTILPGILR